jgi:site-specific DNA-methyltransferase (adenine-specific)
MTTRIEHGDCLEVMRRLVDEGVRVDSIVTDPPYGIGFMGKKWDTPGSFVERKTDTTRTWDHVGGNHNPSNALDAARTRRREGVRFGRWCEDWASAAIDLLRPGGHLVAFGGTRTFHRLACAIEDAGFEIRDQIGWVFGSGFPKSRNVGNGWGTALKPAWEPVCVARKPLIGTVAENVLQHGCGALNIDACRVETAPGDKGEWPITERRHSDVAYTLAPVATVQDKGRWPANVIHDGSEEVLAGFPAEAGGGRSAARFFYCAKASGAERAGSKHPTVKPLALMRYLCRLVTPPGGTVLDPFAGSGSTLQAAVEDGFNAIGIEREAEYVADIERRLERAQPRLVA